MHIKNSILDKIELIFALVWLVVAVGFGLLIFIPINQYNKANAKYDGYISVTYTYQSYKYYSDECSITVKEEDKPLVIYDIYFSAINKDNLSALNSGDIAQCYVESSANKKYAYELVEMYNGDMPIITLQDRGTSGKSNAIAGFIVVPIMSLISLIPSIYYFVKYFKERKSIEF